MRPSSYPHLDGDPRPPLEGLQGEEPLDLGDVVFSRGKRGGEGELFGRVEEVQPGRAADHVLPRRGHIARTGRLELLRLRLDETLCER